MPDEVFTRRLILKPPEKDELQDLRNLFSLEEVQAFLDLDQMERCLGSVNGLLFEIILRQSELVLGAAGLFPLNEVKDGWSCFYALNPRYWGNGYAIEAVKALIRLAFETLDVSSMHVFIDRRNERGWKVAERVGMMYVGHVKHEKMKPNPMHFYMSRKDFEARWTLSHQDEC